MGISLTKKELATAAGYTYRRLYDIDRDLPDNKKLFVASEDDEKKFDLAFFIQRWVAYNVSKAPDLDDLDAVKARHEVVKIEKTELEVARMRGHLVDVQDVRRLWGDIANSVMQNMIHLPSRVAPMLRMLDNQERIASIIDAEIRKALNVLAETPLPDYAADNGEEGDAAPGDESEEDSAP